MGIAVQSLHARRAGREERGRGAVISVVVPTLDEGVRLGSLLRQLLAETEPCEIVVVDGGSRDGTVDTARRRGAIVVHAKANRGAQMAAGARVASGDILLFLHADSRFPAGGLGRLRRALADAPAAPGGNFRLVFDGDDGFSRWLTGFYAWLRRRGLYYGDSGVFVRRAAYRAIGGMRPLALMEDYDLVRRLERAGRTLCIEDPPLVTSSRRFLGRSPPAIVCGWLVIHALYFLGVRSEHLARLYYGASVGTPARRFPEGYGR